jgi:hypothetical protein
MPHTPIECRSDRRPEPLCIKGFAQHLLMSCARRYRMCSVPDPRPSLNVCFPSTSTTMKRQRRPAVVVQRWSVTVAMMG